MEFRTHINAIRMGLPIIYFKASHPNNYVFQSLKIAFILAKSVGPDEMPRFVAFHLGLHCLPKYPFRCFQYTKH